MAVRPWWADRARGNSSLRVMDDQRLRLLLLCGASFALFSLLALGQASAPVAGSSEAAPDALPADPDVESASEPKGSPIADRTCLNLLGGVNAEQGEAQRNENVSITLNDNNVLKELNERFGATTTIFTEFEPELNYSGKVFGGSPEVSIQIVPLRQRDVHGQLFRRHSNNVLSAGSFFRVGAVQHSRDNQYGFDITAPAWRGATVNLTGGQRRFRGQVNGNVLVPAMDERTPPATDPAVRQFVQKILDAYPKQLPNRSDIHPRTLNTDAAQDINDDRGGVTLHQAGKERDRLMARHRFTSQTVEAFQLVRGQKPDTSTRNQLARLTWARSWSPAVTSDFSLGFERLGSVFVADESSLGSFYILPRTGIIGAFEQHPD